MSAASGVGSTVVVVGSNRLLIVPLGVVAGHSIGYHVAHSDPLERAASLGSSHAYLGPVAVLSIVAATAAIAWVATDAVRRRDRIPTAFALVRWQTAAFFAVEVVERFDHQNPVAATAGERAVWVGLAVQVFLAHLATWLLRATKHLVEALVDSVPLRSTRRRVFSPLWAERLSARDVASVSLGRAPPSVARA